VVRSGAGRPDLARSAAERTTASVKVTTFDLRQLQKPPRLMIFARLSKDLCSSGCTEGRVGTTQAVVAQRAGGSDTGVAESGSSIRTLNAQVRTFL
jgi:hypothetical protein